MNKTSTTAARREPHLFFAKIKDRQRSRLSWERESQKTLKESLRMEILSFLSQPGWPARFVSTLPAAMRTAWMALSKNQQTLYVMRCSLGPGHDNSELGALMSEAAEGGLLRWAAGTSALRGANTISEAKKDGEVKIMMGLTGYIHELLPRLAGLPHAASDVLWLYVNLRQGTEPPKGRNRATLAAKQLATSLRCAVFQTYCRQNRPPSYERLKAIERFTSELGSQVEGCRK